MKRKALTIFGFLGVLSFILLTASPSLACDGDKKDKKTPDKVVAEL